MKRAAVGLPSIFVVAALIAGIVGLATLPGLTYNINQIQVGLRQHPSSWGGRVVRVHGWVNGGGGEPCYGPPTATCFGTWVTLVSTPNGHGLQLNVVFPDSAIRYRVDTKSGITIEIPEGVRPDLLYPPSSVATLQRLPILGPLLIGSPNSTTLRVRLLLASPICAHAHDPCVAGMFTP